MEDHRSHNQGLRKVGASWLALFLFVGVLFISLTPGHAFACEESERGKVGCSGEEEQEGNNEEESESDGEEEETSRPSKGDTWTEVRYVQCAQYGEEVPEGFCVSSAAEDCPEGTNYYMTYVRVWTYNGSEWAYDTSEEEDGWVRDHDAPDCRDPEEIEDESGEVTDDVVIRAFNSRPLPSGEIGANPPNGRTLVNFDTIFYTEQGQEEFNLPLQEINQSVRIIATPVSYNWDFGDGGSESWDTKGRAWEDGMPMSEYHTYSYSETGTFRIELTIDYEVRYNDGSGWQTISDPITSRPSDPLSLEVVEKRDRLRSGR